MSEETEEQLTLDKIVTQRRNANRHTQRGMGMLEKSISERGWIGAITAAADGEIFDGSARRETLETAGLDEPIIVRTDGSRPVVLIREDIPTADDPRAVQLALEANRIGQVNLDFDPGVLAELAEDGVDLSGLWFPEELSALLEDVALPEPGGGGDEFDTTLQNGPTRTQLGDLWVIGGVHRLLVGDCTDAANVARLMDGERAALVVTSPPYNQKLDTFKPSGMQKENPAFVHRMAQAYDDNMPEDEYQKRQIELIEMLGQFLTPNASIFYNHKIRYRDKRVVSPMEWLMRVPYSIRQEIIWDRGSSITLNARMFIPADERIYWLRVGDDFVFNDTPDIKAWGTVWDVAAVNEVKASAAFAIEIPTRCIQAASSPDDIVFDPYCGTGTTIIAAHRLARVGYGIERDPRWADVILRRAEAEGLTCERVDG